MQVIYGVNPVLEVLLSQPAMLEKVVIAEGRGGDEARRILKLAAEHGIPVESGGRERLEKLAPRQVHQGVAAICREHAYATVDEVIANRHGQSKYDLVVLLDSVTDPQNLGSIIRTAHCCGANGVIIPENRAASVTASVAKASAGAVQYMPTAMVVNLVRTIEYLQEKGFWIYGTDASAPMDIRQPDYEGTIALIMGSEGRGIRPLVRKKCDFLMAIPMRGRVGSLNVSVATGVILFEILRKWGN
ncbi:MAG: 23S rRNA (guanosine(2251)-2'-O)-methyltransferase RlmB [Syntrophobacteraceae bacterium]|nr:23S rRNA (guanosine(2251)-2'-O)-methyltransferase RlmB [Syntrophobacteraceae bacterium]